MTESSFLISFGFLVVSLLSLLVSFLLFVVVAAAITSLLLSPLQTVSDPCSSSSSSSVFIGDTLTSLTFPSPLETVTNFTGTILFEEDPPEPSSGVDLLLLSASSLTTGGELFVGVSDSTPFGGLLVPPPPLEVVALAAENLSDSEGEVLSLVRGLEDDKRADDDDDEEFATGKGYVLRGREGAGKGERERELLAMDCLVRMLMAALLTCLVCSTEYWPLALNLLIECCCCCRLRVCLYRPVSH